VYSKLSTQEESLLGVIVLLWSPKLLLMEIKPK